MELCASERDRAARGCSDGFFNGPTHFERAFLFWRFWPSCRFKTSPRCDRISHHTVSLFGDRSAQCNANARLCAELAACSQPLTVRLRCPNPSTRNHLFNVNEALPAPRTMPKIAITVNDHLGNGQGRRSLRTSKSSNRRRRSCLLCNGRSQRWHGQCHHLGQRQGQGSGHPLQWSRKQRATTTRHPRALLIPFPPQRRTSTALFGERGASASWLFA